MANDPPAFDPKLWAAAALGALKPQPHHGYLKRVTERAAADGFFDKPKYCNASRDGDCSHPGCPQEANNRANYKSICPLPQYPEED